jgi:dihydroorotate dehydrogenase (NAD+) catalytic subunit
VREGNSLPTLCTVDLSVRIAGIVLSNPVMVASGTFGFGAEYEPYVDVSQLGAIVTKGLTLRRRAGNPPPRIWETPSGMLNCIGLQNPGLDGYLRDHLPVLRSYGIPIIVNIAGDTVEEYAMLASELERHGGADAIETNISCPNVKRGGLAFGVDASSAAAVVRAVKDAVSLPVIAKLSPNVTDIVHIAAACKDAGADALSLINTLLGMAIDVDKKRPALGNVFGGLSGPAVRPVAVRMVWQVYEAVGLPVIGMGGITGGRDAVEFILAGATAVAVGTGNFVDPACSLRVVGEIRDYMIRNGFRTVSEMAGLAHGPQQA